MPDYLTKRHGVWQFARRVPLEYAEFDRRGVIKHSTKVEVRKTLAAPRRRRSPRR
jgi:hypothetical protein